MSADRVLERAINVIGNQGGGTPLRALTITAQVMDASGDETADHVGALNAVMRAAGGSVLGERSQAELLEVFRDALFEVQLG